MIAYPVQGALRHKSQQMSVRGRVKRTNLWVNKPSPILWLIAVKNKEDSCQRIRSISQESSQVDKRCCHRLQLKVDVRRLEFRGPFISFDTPTRLHSIEVLGNRRRSRARASLSG